MRPPGRAGTFPFLFPLPILKCDKMAEERKRLREIENRMRGDLPHWYNVLETITRGLESMAQEREKLTPAIASSWVGQIGRTTTEMRQAESDLTVVAQDLVAAKTDAEYREVLVRAWPTNHFLDRLSYLGAALLGAGGAGFILEGWLVAVLFWTVGLVLMGSGLYGLRKWERKRWDFYADQFSIDTKYRP